MYKRLILVCILVASALVGFIFGTLHKADQGYVKDKSGSEWRLKKMMPLGITGDYIAVYEKE